jgi:hypothetical protein
VTTDPSIPKALGVKTLQLRIDIRVVRKASMNPEDHLTTTTYRSSRSELTDSHGTEDGAEPESRLVVAAITVPKSTNRLHQR